MTTALEECEWCGEQAWRFSCASCDARWPKRVCLDCARRWHSRGASQQHQLADRGGVKHSFVEWLALIPSDPAANANDGDVAADGTLPPSAKIGDAESDGKRVNAENDKIGEKRGFGPHDMRGRDDDDDEVDPGGDSASNDQEDEQEVPQEIPTHLSEETQLDLEDVLNRLPTDDIATLEALADHTHEMIRVEDAVLCHQYLKCEETSCQYSLQHHRHVIERKVCATPKCQSIASYHTHMELCRDTRCPFCVRIHQRRLFGKMHALDYFIQTQRQKLASVRREGGDQARENFVSDQIAALERRKRKAADRVESLNRIVLTERLPVFNFPRFSWHINQEPAIKEEPGVVDSSPQPDKEPIDQEGKSHEPHESAESSVDEAPSSEVEGSANGQEVGAKEQEDYVAGLIARKDSGDEAAKASFEESVQHAFRIVDASFCSPSKSSRCLLNCQSILIHLQHHVNLRVCKDQMCDTVEQHFSHISRCQNQGTDLSCEYCMRVVEREYSRSVEVMEADQPETDLKIQRLISSITESLSNDPHDEREQNVMQFEDELQQAEDHKKALNAKIETARLNLVKSRRRMKRHPSNPPSSVVTGLPLHWVKTATRPPSPTKRRRP